MAADDVYNSSKLRCLSHKRGKLSGRVNIKHFQTFIENAGISRKILHVWSDEKIYLPVTSLMHKRCITDI